MTPGSRAAFAVAVGLGACTTPGSAGCCAALPVAVRPVSQMTPGSAAGYPSLAAAPKVQRLPPNQYMA